LNYPEFLFGLLTWAFHSEFSLGLLLRIFRLGFYQEFSVWAFTKNFPLGLLPRIFRLGFYQEFSAWAFTKKLSHRLFINIFYLHKDKYGRVHL